MGADDRVADHDEKGVPDLATHGLLQRQLRRAGIGPTTPVSGQWSTLLDGIDQAYHEADRNAAIIDHMFGASSKEMRARLDEVVQRADERAGIQHDRLEVVFGSAPSALIMFDRVGRVVSMNGAAGRLFGGQHAALDRNLDEILVIADRDGTTTPLVERPDLDEVVDGGRWIRRDVSLQVSVDEVEGGLDQTTVIAADVMIVRFAADDPELGGLVVITDHVERERTREWLDWQASHDALTGLANRALVTERIDVALAHAHRTGDWPSLLFVDLDRFKPVNDLLGHAFGDRLLSAVAERLEGCVRSADTVARLGSDEFVILCDGTGSGRVGPRTTSVRLLAERILGELAVPFELHDGHRSEQVSVSASIGIAHASAPHQSASSLLRDADLAARSAKQRGRNCYEVADQQLRELAAERAQLERGLRTAISHHEITVVYQPVQNTATGELVGFEAFARWVHPVLGDVRPARFVPVAEQTGLIQALGDRMFDLACRDVATWNRERKSLGLPPIVVHVNISGHELLAPNLLDRVRAAMREHAVLPSWIMVEMTETTLLDDPDTTLERLRELKRAGIRVAIDDFGTGYSSLSALRRYPVHMIKIDREFIAEIVSSKQDQSIVKAIIDLAHGLDHEVLAEGVETTAELDLLRSMGCGLVQGYLLGVPMPSEDALLLATSTSSRTQTRDQAPSASAGTARLLR